MPLGPVTPEAVAALQAEIELLRQAIQLCDELPCRGGKQRGEAQQQTAQGGAAEGAAACRPAAAAAEQQQQQQQVEQQQQQQVEQRQQVEQQQQQAWPAAPDEGQDVLIVPETQENGLVPSPPKPASTAAGGVADARPAAVGPEEAAGAAEGCRPEAQRAPPPPPQPPQEQAAGEQERQRERKRQLGKLQAAQAQQRLLQVGLTQEMGEDGRRMSGKDQGRA